MPPCAGDVTGRGGGGMSHFGLALPFYTHFTSPIRCVCVGVAVGDDDVCVCDGVWGHYALYAAPARLLPMCLLPRPPPAQSCCHSSPPRDVLLRCAGAMPTSLCTASCWRRWQQLQPAAALPRCPRHRLQRGPAQPSYRPCWRRRRRRCPAQRWRSVRR